MSLARAAYSQANVILLDDPLSAVDAHVGKDILDQCLLRGPLADKTRILVTHAIPVLKHVDYVYLMENGVITEEGRYQVEFFMPFVFPYGYRSSLVFQDLIKNGQALARLVEEFGSQEKNSEDTESLDEDEELDKPKAKQQGSEGQAALMQAEERNTGQVESVIYKKYLKAAGGLSWAPLLILLLALSQASQGTSYSHSLSRSGSNFTFLSLLALVGNNLFLGFWTSNSIAGFRQGEYIAVYASLGVAQGVFSFAASFAFRWGPKKRYF